MGFTKLDSGIVDSSIWSEPLATRVVWITILAKSNHVGIVSASRSGLLRASNVTEKEFDEAMKSLESPDPDSRTTDNEGRRIEKIEGGWKILNYLKYREYTYSNNPDSVRQREYRKNKVVTSRDMSQNSCDISASASASASKEEEVQEKGKKTGTKNPENDKYLPLSKYLLEKIKTSGTDAVFNETHLNSWNNSFRLMVEQDHRTEAQIRAVIDSVFSDGFWSKQIRSAGTLREKWKAGRFDRLSVAEPEAPKKPLTLWETFLGDDKPSRKLTNWLFPIWESVYGDGDYREWRWSDDDDTCEQMWEFLQTCRKAGNDKKTCFDRLKTEFNLERCS